MTTVTTSGAPLPRPVWFLWDGAESVLVYSRAGARIRNIQANPRVTFNFDGDGHGGDIVVLTGRAPSTAAAPGADRDEEYLGEVQSQHRSDRHVARGLRPALLRPGPHPLLPAVRALSTAGGRATHAPSCPPGITLRRGSSRPHRPRQARRSSSNGRRAGPRAAVACPLRQASTSSSSTASRAPALPSPDVAWAWRRLTRSRRAAAGERAGRGASLQPPASDHALQRTGRPCA